MAIILVKLIFISNAKKNYHILNSLYILKTKKTDNLNHDFRLFDISFDVVLIVSTYFMSTKYYNSDLLTFTSILYFIIASIQYYYINECNKLKKLIKLRQN